LQAVTTSVLLGALTACSHPSGVVVVAFPHGGDGGAAGIRADAAATAALQSRGIAVEHLDLDSGVQNPHQDEGTDDERAIARAAGLPELLAGRRDIAGIIVGPTRAVADAVPWRRLPMRVVAVAPLVRDVACACRTERALRMHDGDVIIESTDGQEWADARGRSFAHLAGAAANRISFDVVNRRGFQYRVLQRSRAALLADPDALDRRDFSASRLGLVPSAAEPSIESRARDAVSKLLR
jgi:hypothetical protein